MIINAAVSVFNDCLWCHGQGELFDQPTDAMAPCPHCYGSGRLPNDLGDDILDLIEWRERKKAAEAKAATPPVVCWKCHQPITAEHPDDGRMYPSMPPKFAHATCPPKPTTQGDDRC